MTNHMQANERKMVRPIFHAGKLVSLGVMLPCDADFLFSIGNDLKIYRYFRLFRDGYTTYEQALQSIADGKNNLETERMLSIVNPDDTIMGIVKLHRIDLISGTSHVSYVLAKEFWGRGYMTEAAGLAIEYAFKQLNLRKLYTHVLEPNIASKRILVRYGFKEVGRFSKHIFVPGMGYVDDIWYELFNETHL